MKLSDMQLFRGLKEEEIASLLSCLSSVKRNYKKGEVILSEGSITENIGIVLSGMAMISCNDIWGNTSILGNVAPGSVFAEVYACIPGQPMLVTVSAAEDTSVLFMNVGRVLTACTHSQKKEDLKIRFQSLPFKISQNILFDLRTDQEPYRKARKSVFLVKFVVIIFIVKFIVVVFVVIILILEVLVLEFIIFVLIVIVLIFLIAGSRAENY
ncbi:putative uncharacterized protein [Lachnospiraceae bacterium CAG:215]|nr:putative uncharacterized protein [Lachnospiraceae bacterium CAG:215]